MVQSMTGYASCCLEQDHYQINLEAKSVNNRFFSLSYRSVGGLDKYEEFIRNSLQKVIARGSINIFVKLKNTSTEGRPQLNTENIRAVTKQIQEIATELEISRQITMDTILRISGTVANGDSEEKNEEEENIKFLLGKALDQVSKDLVIMRENEGRRLLEVIHTQLKEISEIQEKIKAKFQNSQKEIAEELLEKVNKTAQLLKSEASFEQKDLLKEVILMAERADITEEINRIKSHIVETKKTMSEKGQIGKKLDFLCQEFSREFNTICSKTKNIEISQLGLAGKLEVEKIREQVQNIE